MEHKKGADSDGEDQEIEDLKLQLPLNEGCLKVNLGVPIMIIVNKSDLLLHGDKKAFLEDNFDVI